MRYLESRESASPLVSRSVASALRNEFCDPYSLYVWQKLGLGILGLFPGSLARWVMERVQSPMALGPENHGCRLVEDLIQERLMDYENLPGPFPSITMGVPVGGAAAHLAVSVGGPFLPQAFVLTIRGGTEDGNPHEYMMRSERLSQQIVDANPEIMTIQHYDPVHDGWLTRRVNHLRLKLVNLPQSYSRYIRQNLIPGGDLIYLEGRALWQRYRLSDRRVLQIGGWGGIPSEEYLNGSCRLRQYCQDVGLKNSNWRLSGYPLEVGPESEWGSEPGLAEALEEFCQQEGYCFRRIACSHPHDFSRLALYAMKERMRQENRSAAGVLIEMFSQYDVTVTERLGLLPIWLIFNTEDSRQFLQSMMPELDSGIQFYFSALSTFSITPDMVSWKDWERTFSEVRLEKYRRTLVALSI